MMVMFLCVLKFCSKFVCYLGSILFFIFFFCYYEFFDVGMICKMYIFNYRVCDGIFWLSNFDDIIIWEFLDYFFL